MSKPGSTAHRGEAKVVRGLESGAYKDVHPGAPNIQMPWPSGSVKAKGKPKRTGSYSGNTYGQENAL